MSKVYNYYLEMEELAQDVHWQAWQEEELRLTNMELDAMQAYGYENMEDNKAEEFARKVAAV